MLRRVVLGKSIGFGIGLLGFVMIPYLFPDTPLLLRIGVLMWYTMMGAMIALGGVIDEHPWFGFSIIAPVRGAIFGAIMNTILVCIAFESFVSMFSALDISPFWVVAEGLVIGLIIDVIITKKTGEGAALCSNQ